NGHVPSDAAESECAIGALLEYAIAVGIENPEESLTEQTDLRAAVPVPIAHHGYITSLDADTEVVHLVGGGELPVAIVVENEEAIAGSVHTHLTRSGAIPIAGDGNVAGTSKVGVRSEEP